jgi:O-antigen/teichoic acid export membrane protein
MSNTESQVKRRPSLKLNALSNFGGLAVNLAVGFFLTPAMLSYLGEKRFGIWTLVSSLVGYYGLLDFGVGSAVFRYVPLFHGQGNHHRVSSVISTSMAFYAALSLVIVATTQVLAGPIASFYDGGPELAKLLRLIGLATALGLPTIVLNTSIKSYEGFAPSNIVTASTQLLRGALLVACMLAGYSLVEMGLAVLVVGLVSLVGNFIIFKRICHDARLSLSSIRWTDLKMLLTFGSVILIVGTANSLATESPKQIVAKTLSLEALGLFGIPLLVISYYRMLIISLTNVFSPRFSYLSGREAQEEIRLLFVQGCRYIAILAGAVALLLWIAGPSFVLLWAHKPQLAKAFSALGIMTAGTFVFLSHRLGGDLLFGLGLQKQVALLELLEAVGIVGLTIPLSIKFGIAGAGLGLALPPIIVRGFLQTRFVSQALKMSFFQYYARCILRTWVVVLAVWALAQPFRWRELITGWPTLVAVSALLMLVYFGGIYLLVLEPAEKLQLKEQLARIRSRVGLLRAGS